MLFSQTGHNLILTSRRHYYTRVPLLMRSPVLRPVFRPARTEWLSIVLLAFRHDKLQRFRARLFANSLFNLASFNFLAVSRLPTGRIHEPLEQNQSIWRWFCASEIQLPGLTYNELFNRRIEVCLRYSCVRVPLEAIN